MSNAPGKGPGYGSISSSGEHMELAREESSTAEGNNNNNRQNGSSGSDGPTSKPNTVGLAISALLLAVLAYLGGKASTGGPIIGVEGPETKLPQDVGRQSAIPTRLCEVHYKGGVRVIQTSLGEPSRQWGEVACGVAAGRKLQGEAGEDLAKNGEEVEYGRPSARIRVDFSKVAFPDREPILGFGGAFTEAAALNFWSLGKEGQDAAMELLFGKEGLGYSLGRTHMNSCDFCVQSYSFDDTDDDFNLTNFDPLLTHDLESGMIDMMLLATKTLRDAYPKETENPSLGGMRIIASPWSPPSWMKAPTEKDEDRGFMAHAENMTGSALPVCIRDGVGRDSEYAKSWALYFSKFISGYKNHGINFYGVTVQNEPEFPAPWDACAFDYYTQGDFIANHLGPQLAKSHPDIKLLIFDHNKDHVIHWAKYLLDSNHPASQYIDGTAYHWYAGGMDRLLDGAQGNPNMHRLLSEFDVMNVDKKHLVLGSEACHCPSTGYAGGDLNIAWARASRNAHTILADLAAGSNGFIEWNLILDSVGGPNHLGNMCDSPLLAVPHRALGAQDVPVQLDFEHAGYPFGPVFGDQKTRDELNAIGIPAKYLDVGVVVQPMYYYVGHITKFVRPGSRAVHGLVDSSFKDRTFRPKGQSVAGGGINDLARNGIEVTVWPCEGSTRQEWNYNNDKQFQVFGHDWLGVPTTSCLSKRAEKDLGGLMLTICNMTEHDSGVFDIVPVEEDSGKIKIVLANGKVGADRSCLIIQPLRNYGGAYGPRGGAQVNLGDCAHSWAEWSYDQETGEILSSVYSDVGGDVCLTTGWPFLQVGAFDTSAAGDDGKTVVILNEAGESANFVLKDGDDLILTSSIPPHSIQTVAFD
eukprot:CAMPEP_0171384842 /NCGR_PEP_ID=MMETSP0879-20121228/38678_1 /TAXON_ID=67004 /ORGANISM="Thalassiosira weissflogii, Strain CCMP1336" /LENGTH=863 /DNA_ID=CAMNT_0011897127 /DNA_START=101 /DNA_END=2693 /DNA_ORIENTATION=+